MKTLHAIAFSLLASLSMATAADLPSPLLPLPREQPQWWRQQYEQQVEQVKNNPCGVLFLGDSITDYWKREGKQVWEKEFKPFAFTVDDNGLPVIAEGHTFGDTPKPRQRTSFTELSIEQHREALSAEAEREYRGALQSILEKGRDALEIGRAHV